VQHFDLWQEAVIVREEQKEKKRRRSVEVKILESQQKALSAYFGGVTHVTITVPLEEEDSQTLPKPVEPPRIQHVGPISTPPALSPTGDYLSKCTARKFNSHVRQPLLSCVIYIRTASFVMKN
jgi:hypothetical protein